MAGTYEHLTLHCEIDGRNWAVVVPCEVPEDELGLEDDIPARDFEDWIAANAARIA